MILQDEDITTREVLDWQGVHLLHFGGSSCSQKTRIFLNLKGIDWQSHPVNLATQDNYKPWFLGINPRGLLPVLVHDGVVHIESNDILTYLDETFPEPCLIPRGQAADIAAALQEEDDLHLAIRALTMRFVVPKKLAQKSAKSLAAFQTDTGTVRGERDPHKAVELEFWQAFANTGVTDTQAADAARAFKSVYERHEAVLETQPYLGGEDLTLVDIAWFIYTHRLTAAGYPFPRMHAAVHAWYEGLLARDAFAREVATPAPLAAMTRALHVAQALRGKTLAAVAGFG